MSLKAKELQEIADRVGYKRIIHLDKNGYAGILWSPAKRSQELASIFRMMQH